MENHIDSTTLDSLLEQFMHEHPYGDTRDLATFMYNHGWEDGMTSTCDLM